MKTFVLWYRSWTNQVDVPICFQARDLDIAIDAGKRASGPQFLSVMPIGMVLPGNYNSITDVYIDSLEIAIHTWEQFCLKYAIYD